MSEDPKTDIRYIMGLLDGQIYVLDRVIGDLNDIGHNEHKPDEFIEIIKKYLKEELDNAQTTQAWMATYCDK